MKVEPENLSRRITRTLQEDADKSLHLEKESYWVAGSTYSGSLGASLSGASGPSLPEPNTETSLQVKGVYTLTIADGDLRANLKLNLRNQHSNTQTFMGHVYQPQASLNGGLINTEMKKQQLACSTVDAELMTTVKF